ncbi:HD domain-containing protein [Candidatus Parcubacteria bacterium]|nr:HD domain-containing protein [Candidatus Parcubacteria bacterium]
MFDKIDKIRSIIKKSSNPKLIEEAFRFAETAYKGKQRISGENYIDHTTRVALMLDSISSDPEIIAAGLLHDVLDDLPQTMVTKQLNELERKFGKEIAFFVERNPEIHKVRYPLLIDIKEKTRFTKEKFEKLQKMFFALAQDLRVVLIELSSRIDNLNNLFSLPQEKQKIYALETLKIFVPIAERLGIWEIKSRLEDLSFSYLFPEKFTWLKSYIKTEYEERKKYLKSFSKHLKKILGKERILVLDMNWRPKSYWSTYKKLLKKNMDIEKVHDLLALRIIVKDIKSCYKTLGIIHKYYKPLYEEIDDYIAKPKSNGYRSLHTTVFCEKGHITEIQIRTPIMHREAEYGICAHWAYKEKIDLKKDKENLEFIKEIPEFWRTFKIDFYKNQVFVFTPRGDVIILPENATPVDFAYAVHSDIGNHCEAAKINNKIANLSQPLKNGDIVEIIVNKKRSPSTDWLKFVKSNLAISQIKKELTKKTILNKIASLGKIPSFVKRKVFEVSERITKKPCLPANKKNQKKKKRRKFTLPAKKEFWFTKLSAATLNQVIKL